MRTPARIILRGADASHAPRLHALIAANRDEGRLRPLALDEIVGHAERFVVALKGRTIVGCAELAPLGPLVAEIRSLVPHLWLTEKIVTDCVGGPSFRRCGQYAMVVSLEDVHWVHDRRSKPHTAPPDAASVHRS